VDANLRELDVYLHALDAYPPAVDRYPGERDAYRPVDGESYQEVDECARGEDELTRALALNSADSFPPAGGRELVTRTISATGGRSRR
jgi:hypothetical protein